MVYITCKNQRAEFTGLHRRVYVILSTCQLALFQLPSDLYMYLASLLLSAMSRAVHTPASEARVIEQSLSLSHLGTGHNWIQKNNELKHLS